MSKGKRVAAQRVVLYGPGGIGKSELCSLLSGVGLKPLFFDVEGGSDHLDIDRIEAGQLQTLDDLRAALANDALCGEYNAIVIDSLTRCEMLATAWTIKNVPHPEKRDRVIKGIEDYGYGKGYQFVYETFLTLLGDLDRHIRAGRHVICTAHECTSPVPNPEGDDWIRYEPRLQSPSSGKASIRLQVKEWAGHLLFIGYDVAVDDGKGVGGGTRTIYPAERPAWMAKSRTLSEPLVYEKGSSEIWKQLLKGN